MEPSEPEAAPQRFTRDEGERLAFGPFVLDCTGRKLFCKSREVSLRDRALDVLIELVLRAGEVVSKEDLLERVWSGEEVYEWALTQAVHHAREALGDDPHHPRYLRTVHKVGYQFIARVTPVAPAEVLPRRRFPWPLAFGLAGLAAGIALWKVTTTRPSTRPNFGKIREVCRLPGGAFKPSVSPDGKLLSLVTVRPSGAHGLVLLDPKTGGQVLLSGDLDVRGPSPVFTPDGRRLIFAALRSPRQGPELPDLWEVPLVGGRPRLLVSLAWAGDLEPNQDERLVFSMVRGTVTSVAIRDRTGKTRVLVERGFWPRWAPGGGRIAYTTSNPEGGEGAIWVVNANSGIQEQVTPEYAQVYGLSWTTRPEGVIYGAQKDEKEPFQLFWVNPETKLPQQLTVGTGDYVSPVVGPEGTVFFVAGKHQNALFTAEGPSSGFHRAHNLTDLEDAVFEEEGHDIFYLRRQSERSEVCRWHLGEDTPTCVSVSGAFRLLRAVRQQAWVATRHPDSVVVERVNLATGEAQALETLPPHATMVDLSRDGSVLAWTSHERGLEEFVATSKAWAQVRFQVAEVSSFSLSASGRFLAWAGRLRPEGHAHAGLWVKELPHGPQTRIVEDGYLPVWGSDDTIFFLRKGAHTSIWQLTVPQNQGRQIWTVGLPHFPLRLLGTSPQGPFGIVAQTDAPALFALEGWAP